MRGKWGKLEKKNTGHVLLSFIIFTFTLSLIAYLSPENLEISYFLSVFSMTIFLTWLMNSYMSFYKRELFSLTILGLILSFLGYLNLLMRSATLSILILFVSLMPAIMLDFEKENIGLSVISLATSTILSIGIWLFLYILAPVNQVGKGNIGNPFRVLFSPETLVSLSCIIPPVMMFDLAHHLFVFSFLEEQPRPNIFLTMLLSQIAYWTVLIIAFLRGVKFLSLGISIEKSIATLLILMLARIIFEDLVKVEKSYAHSTWGFPLLLSLFLSSIFRL